MNYDDVLALIEQAQIDEASRTGRVLSQIYGYRYRGDGQFELVETEAKVIQDVISQIAMIDFMKLDKLIAMILSDFESSKTQTRNRSGRRWTKITLCGLIRPVYAGLALDSWGRLTPVSNYPPIVDVEIYRRAALRLKNAGLLPEKVPL